MYTLPAPRLASTLSVASTPWLFLSTAGTCMETIFVSPSRNCTLGSGEASMNAKGVGAAGFASAFAWNPAKNARPSIATIAIAASTFIFPSTFYRAHVRNALFYKFVSPYVFPVKDFSFNRFDCFLRYAFCLANRIAFPENCNRPRASEQKPSVFLAHARVKHFPAERIDFAFVHGYFHPFQGIVGIAFGNGVFHDRSLAFENGVLLRERAVDYLPAQFSEIALQQRQDVHRLRVRKTSVVLDEFWALAREHELAVQNPFVLHSAFLQRAHRLRHRFESLVFFFERNERKQVVCVGVRAHSARVAANCHAIVSSNDYKSGGYCNAAYKSIVLDRSNVILSY